MAIVESVQRRLFLSHLMKGHKPFKRKQDAKNMELMDDFLLKSPSFLLSLEVKDKFDSLLIIT